jgi:thiamine biosynthesis lipoprotein
MRIHSQAAILVACVAMTCPVQAQERHEFTEVHMGMPVRIVLYAADTETARAAARAAYTRIAELERYLSDYRPDSELGRLQRRPGEWISLTSELFTVLETALQVARASHGSFDPTVGPLSVLWREARSRGTLPLPTAIDSARARTGWKNIALDRSRRAVRLAPGMRLDLGGIAKGFILQDALAVLRSHGPASALLAAGGDIVVGAAPPGRAGWRIETPHADDAVAARAAALANAAVATSGSSAQFVIIDGVRYSHVVDPVTGIGLTHDVHATVIAQDAALADALATALTVIRPDSAPGLLARFPDVIASVRGSATPTPASRLDHGLPDSIAEGAEEARGQEGARHRRAYIPMETTPSEGDYGDRGNKEMGGHSY